MMARPQPRSDCVEECRLPRTILLLDIIEENGEITHAHAVKRLTLRQHNRKIFLPGMPAIEEIHAWRNSENETHPRRLRRLYERCKLGELLRRIRQAPLTPMIGIVLRCIDISVESHTTAKREHIKPFLLCPGRTVKALDHTAQRHGIRRCLLCTRSGTRENARQTTAEQ